MSDLLNLAVEAHGGLERWRRLGSVSARLSIGGVLWDGKGQTGLFADTTFAADLRGERALLGDVGGPDRWVRFTPERLELVDGHGHVLDARDDPRAAFAGHTNETPWDVFHAAYFSGYALWTYLSLPFLYTYPGFVVEEIEPWTEGDETWRRLKATFPESIASHTKTQTSYFGPDGLLRRHDYTVDVLGGADGCHYVEDYHDCDGIKMPFRRRIYPRGPDNRKVPEPVLVSIDVKSLHYAPAEFSSNAPA